MTSQKQVSLGTLINQLIVVYDFDSLELVVTSGFNLFLFFVVFRRPANDRSGKDHFVFAPVGLRHRLDHVVRAADQLDQGGPGRSVPTRLPVGELHPGEGVVDGSFPTVPVAESRFTTPVDAPLE